MWPLLQQSFDSHSKFAKNISKCKFNLIYFVETQNFASLQYYFYVKTAFHSAALPLLNAGIWLFARGDGFDVQMLWLLIQL